MNTKAPIRSLFHGAMLASVLALASGPLLAIEPFTANYGANFMGLQADGRMTNVELAERVGISPPPCLRRVRKLEEAGVIEGAGGLEIVSGESAKRIRNEE